MPGLDPDVPVALHGDGLTAFRVLVRVVGAQDRAAHLVGIVAPAI